MAAEVVFDRTLPVNVQSPTANSSAVSRCHDLAIQISLIRNTSGSVDINMVITDELDPYFLYTLRLTDEDFSCLRRSQDIKVDFSSFPKNLVELLEKCASTEVSKCQLELDTNPSDSGPSTSLASLNIIELNSFKNLVHLSLKFLPGTDASIKKHLAGCLQSYKAENSALQIRLANTTKDLNKKLSDAKVESEANASECRKATAQLATITGQLKAEHTVELAALKESHLAEQSRKQVEFDRERSDAENRTASRLSELESKNCMLTKKSADAENLIVTLKSTVKELEAKLRSSESVARSTEEDLEASRSENLALKQTKHEQDCALNENRVRIAELTQEVKGKMENEKKQIDTTSAVQSRCSQLEEAVRVAEKQRDDLQRVVKASAGEIKKGNGIIVRLQNELSALRSKLDTRNSVVVKQEQSISRTEKELANKQLELKESHSSIQLLENSLKASEAKSKEFSQKLEEAQRQIKNSEGVISWLNKQLNDGGARKYTFDTYKMNPMPDTTRVPFGDKTGDNLNKRHVAYTGKSMPKPTSDESSALFNYLPNQVKKSIGNGGNDDKLSRIPQPSRLPTTTTSIKEPPTRDTSLHSTSSLIRTANALLSGNT